MIQKLKQYLTLSDLPVLALCCVIIQFPIYRLYIPLTLGVWILLTIINGIVKKEKYTFNFRLILPALFFAWYSLGLLWSSNIKSAQFDLEIKMSLAIVPIVFMYTNYSKKQMKLLLYTFIFGLLFSIGVLFLRAYMYFYCSCNFQHFFYTQLSSEIHPSYLSFYFNVGISVLLIDYITGSLGLFKKRSLYIALIVIFGMFSGFLLSKIGFLTTMILIFVLYIFWFRQKKWKILLVFLTISLAVPTVIYQKSEVVQRRVEDLITGIEYEGDQRWLESTAIRKKVWEISTDVIIKNVWRGVGTGDVQDALMEEYKSRDLNQIANLNLNAHNQYLQTTLALGIGGGVLFLFLFLQPIIGLRKEGYYNLVFSMICLLFFLTESVLETQAGVVFIAVFYSIFNQMNFKSQNEASDTDPVLSA